MAIRIPKGSLTTDLKKNITRDLWITEKFSMTDELRTIKCFNVDDQGFVHLPHSYALELTPKLATLDWKRPELNYNIEHLKFTGNLLQDEERDQKTVAAEAWNHLINKGCVLLNARPGFGKTMLFTAISCRLKVRALVLCTQDRLLNQAMETYRENSNARLCKLSDIKGQLVEEDVWNETDIFFSTEKSCHKLGPYSDLIGTLIVDECHEFCSPTRIEAMLKFHPKYLICCSASLNWKRDGLEQAMWKFVSEDTTIVRKFGKRFYVFRYNCKNNIELKTNRGKLDYLSYIKDLHQDPKLMEELMEVISLNIKNHKILILAKNIEFVDKIQNEIVVRNIYDNPSTLRGNISVYRDSKILIGTFQKIGTGFDPKSKTWDGVHFDLLILVDTTKTTCLLEQLYGRVFRSKLPIVVNWICNNSISNSHFSAHQKWYKSYSNAVYLDCYKPISFLDAVSDLEASEDVSRIKFRGSKNVIPEGGQ